MIPAGSTTFNTAVIDSMIAEVNSITLCHLLQPLVNEIMADLNALSADISAEIAKLAPLLDLLTVDIDTIVTWAEGVIENVIKPMLQPYYTMIAQAALLAEKVVQLMAAIINKISTIGNCSFTIPPFVPVVVPS